MSGPVPAALTPLAAAASWAYGRAVAVRNRRYDRTGRSRRLDVPVVSVGNVTAGGVGKTPFVAWLADLLLRHGVTPVVAMRGYGARRGERSDEEQEYAARLPSVAVVADPDRHTALSEYLAAHPDVGCVLLDDGFQHRRLHRDLDLVLVDASRSALEDHLLPWGYLREPPENLRRADGVVMTRASSVDETLGDAVRRLHGRPPLAWSRPRWPSLERWTGAGAAETVPCGWLEGRRLLVMLGVGNPSSILEQIERAGATVAVRIPARDHERYGPAKLERVRRRLPGADAMLVTGKDWVKVRGLIDLAAWPVPVIVPNLVVDVFSGESELTALVLRTVHVG